MAAKAVAATQGIVLANIFLWVLGSSRRQKLKKNGTTFACTVMGVGSG